MKKIITVILSLLFVSFSFAEKSNENCAKIHQLINKVISRQLDSERKESIPTEDLEMWKAATTLDGAKRCYIQDAYAYKIYVADFEYAAGGKLDEKLVKTFLELNTQLSNCLKNEFSSVVLNTDENILRATDYMGLGKYNNVKIQLYIIYNPADKKQTLFMALMYDPG
jgi:hypothetical protein